MRAGYCIYCDRTVETLTDEHVLPADIGSTLVIDSCDACNATSAARTEKNLRSFPDVGMLSAMYDIRNARHRGRRKRYQLTGELGDGSRALYAPHDEAELRQVTVSRPQVQPDGTSVYAFPPEHYKTQSQKLKEKLEDENPGRSVTLGESWSDNVEGSFAASHLAPAHLWPALGAKVALALGQLVLPSAWSSNPAAIEARALFHTGKGADGRSVTELGLNPAPRQLYADDPFFDMLRPWEHMLSARTDAGAFGIRGVLFGELEFSLSLACDLEMADGPKCWLIDARAFSFMIDSPSGIAAHLTQRVAMEGWATDLHRERPRPTSQRLERR